MKLNLGRYQRTLLPSITAMIGLFVCGNAVVRGLDGPPSSQERRLANPSQLPKPARQLPLFQRYRGRDLRGGESYRDPATGVRVTKLTDASTPEANKSGLHHYASGPAQISREWGAEFHTINITAGGNDYLVDYQRGGVLSNWRRAPFIGADLTFGFALSPDTPRIAYSIRDKILERYDTAQMAYLGSAKQHDARAADDAISGTSRSVSVVVRRIRRP